MKKLESVKIALSVIGLIWIIFLADIFLNLNLRSYGIIPRQTFGLKGILFAPFLHANLHHIIANTGTLFILLVVSFSYSRKLTLHAIVIVIFLGGGLVWVFGTPNSNHIGASGVIFGLLGFLMFIGLFRREWMAFLLSIGIFLLYGGALLSFLHILPNVSWAGHFFGFVSGVVAAWHTKEKKAE